MQKKETANIDAFVFIFNDTIPPAYVDKHSEDPQISLVLFDKEHGLDEKIAGIIDLALKKI